MIGKVTNTICKRRIKFCLYPIFILSSVFIIYQLVIFRQLNHESTSTQEDSTEITVDLVRGIHEGNKIFYEKNSDNTFKCMFSMEVISFDQINDDYCDCLDGTDEPGTNACHNGQFYCRRQRSFKNFPKRVPSNRVNDGICDCCDGSDEWQNKVKSDLTGMFVLVIKIIIVMILKLVLYDFS